MNFFFVFQNKSYEEEYRGGYLWAPQRGNSGRRVSHWEKMRSVKRGDIIIHSYRKQIMAISIAKQDVYEAKRPSELSNEWQQNGWRVDVIYIPFQEKLVTSECMDALLRLQPTVDAPFNRRGRGNTGYLFAANREMYEFIIKQTATAQREEEEKKRVRSLAYLGERNQETVTELELEMKVEEIAAKRLSPEELAQQAKSNHAQTTHKTDTVVYYRNPYIKELVKQFAEGHCQLCGQEAPFLDKDGKAYLEEHHVQRLADGGRDAIDNVVAICPNCHRRIHVLQEEADRILLEKLTVENQRRYHRLIAYSSIKKDTVNACAEAEYDRQTAKDRTLDTEAEDFSEEY